MLILFDMACESIQANIKNRQRLPIYITGQSLYISTHPKYSGVTGHLNILLILMPSFLILELRVETFKCNIDAAPSGPDTFPLHLFNTRRICSLSFSSYVFRYSSFVVLVCFFLFTGRWISLITGPVAVSILLSIRCSSSR